MVSCTILVKRWRWRSCWQLDPTTAWWRSKLGSPEIVTRVGQLGVAFKETGQPVVSWLSVFSVRLDSPLTDPKTLQLRASVQAIFWTRKHHPRRPQAVPSCSTSPPLACCCVSASLDASRTETCNPRPCASSRDRPGTVSPTGEDLAIPFRRHLSSLRQKSPPGRLQHLSRPFPHSTKIPKPEPRKHIF